MFPEMDVYELMQLLQSAKPDPDQILQQLQQMDAADLNPIVSQVLGKQATVQTWQATLFGGLDSSLINGGVYRVEGTAVTAGNNRQNWAFIAKNLRSLEGLPLPDGTALSREWAEIQDGFLYWRREALVADSGLLSDLPADLVAPRSWGTIQISDGELCLWQEYIAPDNRTWAMVDYREAAYRLGKWQGQTLTAQSLPGQKQTNLPWLSQNWLAGWTENSLIYLVEMIQGMNGWQHPLLSAYFRPDELTQMQQLWENRHDLLAQLASLPKSLCHLDIHRANMVWRENDLVLLDWAYVGQAALGEELAALVGATLWLNHVPLVEAEILETAVFDGYLAGLRAGGWEGDPAPVWQAYHCHMPLRYTLNALFNMLRTAVDPGFGEEWEQKTKQPLAKILLHEADTIRFFLPRFSKAISAF